MNRRIVRLLTFVGFAAVGLASLSYADPITVPTGLTAGEMYRLVFVTSGTDTATSTNIADYNTFVTAQANSDPTLAALGTTWTAIASTDTVDALSNVGQDLIPLYNLDGQEVQSDTYYDGAVSLFGGYLTNPIDYDQVGDELIASVWTGSFPDGEPATTFVDGGYYSVALGSEHGAEFGQDYMTGSGWSTFSPYPNSGELALYGISAPLTYEPVQTTPEPGTVSLLMLGGMFLAGKVQSKHTKASGGASPKTTAEGRRITCD